MRQSPKQAQIPPSSRFSSHNHKLWYQHCAAVILVSRFFLRPSTYLGNSGGSEQRGGGPREKKPKEEKKKWVGAKEILPALPRSHEAPIIRLDIAALFIVTTRCDEARVLLSVFLTPQNSVPLIPTLPSVPSPNCLLSSSTIRCALRLPHLRTSLR